MADNKKPSKSPALDALKIDKPKEDNISNSAASPKINFNNTNQMKRHYSISSSSPELSSLNASLSTISHFGSAASILMGGIKAKRLSETDGKEPGTPFKLASVDSSTTLPAFPLLSAYSSAAQISSILPSVESVLNAGSTSAEQPATETKRSRAKKVKAPQTDSPKKEKVEKEAKKPRKTRPISHLQLFPFDVTSPGLLSAIQNKSDDATGKKEEIEVNIPLNINPTDSNPMDVDIPQIGKLTNKTPKKARTSRGETDTHNASLPPELASLLPDAGNGSGSSCHQCKSLRDVLIYCSSMFANEKSPVGPVLPNAVKDKRKICHKKYCVSCLKKFYNEVPPLPFNNPSMFWACPACRGFCECAACRRRNDKPSDKVKLNEVKLQRAQYQLQLLFAHHQDLIHNTQKQHHADEQKVEASQLAEAKANHAEIIKGLLENFTAQMKNVVATCNKDGIALQECYAPTLLNLSS